MAATTPEYKMVVLGSGAVGKSAVTLSLICSSFTEAYDPTIEDSYQKQTCVDNETCRFDILDTAGQEEYSAMRDQYMRTGQGFMLVFSLTDRYSFDELAQFAEQISRVQDKDVTDVPIVVVGNKSDLMSERQVTTGEAQAFAKAINAPYLETSAKLRSNIDECFHETVREIKKDIERQNAKMSSTRNSNNKQHSSTNKPLAKKQRKNPIARLFKKVFSRQA